MKWDRPTLKVKTIKKPRITQSENTINKLLSKNESNPVYYITKQIRLITLIKSTNPNSSPPASPELLSVSENDLKDVGRILASDSLRRVAWYFLDYGAATAYILQFRVDVPEASAFRHIKSLQKMGMLVPALKSRHPVDTRGGPRPTVWMVPDAEFDQINEAQKLHKRLLSPKYIAGDRLGQLILEDFLEPRKLKEITGREVWSFAREHKIRGELDDIVFFAMNYLGDQGIKVWR